MPHPPTQEMLGPSTQAPRRRYRGGGRLRRYRPAIAILAALALALVVARLVVGGGEEAGAAALGPVPEVEAAAFAVLDGRTQRILAGREADTRRPVASLTKMMTAHLVLRAGAPGRQVLVPPLALASDESNIRLRPGERQRRDVLLRAMMIVSAGDAADALAADVAGSVDAFVAMMNATADDLSLDDTTYANPSGIDDRAGRSSARDSVRLAFVLMQGPRFRAIAIRREARLHGEVFQATNRLLGSYPGADGVKTGFTDGAGLVRRRIGLARRAAGLRRGAGRAQRGGARPGGACAPRLGLGGRLIRAAGDRAGGAGPQAREPATVTREGKPSRTVPPARGGSPAGVRP